MLRDTRLLVDLDVLETNIDELRDFLDVTAPVGTRRPRLAAVLKADAYGLGALRVAECLQGRGVDLIAVACLPEALELRRRFPAVDLLVMGHTPEAQFRELIRNRIICTLYDEFQAASLSRAALAEGRKAVVHVKIDSGMNRLGIKTAPGAIDTLEAIASERGLEVEGIFTHLALESETSDRAQFDRFSALIEQARLRGLEFKYRHVCDSIGLARYPEFRLDLVRPGAIIYGVLPKSAPLLESRRFGLPLSFRSRITRLRRLEGGEGVGYDYSWKAPPSGALVATLPAGYADGYPRCLSNIGEVMLRGTRAPVIGLVCMDQLNIDASDIPDAAEGDEVILFGAGPGSGIDSGIPLLETASKAGTNRNELLASISRRVPRVYHRSGKPAGHIEYLLGEESRDDRS